MGWMTEISGLSPPLKSQAPTVIPLSQTQAFTRMVTEVGEVPPEA